MYRVVRNAAMDHRRSSARRRQRERRVAEARLEWFLPRPAALIDAETAERCLAGLEPGDREIVVLRIWSGLSFAQIAAVVQHSASTVHSRYELALARMRAVLEIPCVTTTTTTATPDRK
jgi:RNA polymerase sigma-70 factor (ECF subfamily)